MIAPINIFSVCILKVYYANTRQKTIERVDFNGESREILVSEGLDSPEGLAIDWVHRRMYWTDKRCVVFAEKLFNLNVKKNILELFYSNFVLCPPASQPLTAVL